MGSLTVSWFVAIRRPKRPDNRFFRSNEQSSVRTLREKGVVDEVEHLNDLKRLREILRKHRRKLVATMVGAKKEPTKFAPLVELQEACDAVQWALEDEAAAAEEGERE